jgi:uncharacterized protein YjbI with pentapeptide repeats
LANIEPAFLCSCKEQMRPACSSQPFYQEHDGKRYCVFHYPGNDKVGDFNSALKTKLNARDLDFRGIWFPGEADFAEFSFENEANFNEAIFTGWTSFRSAKFQKEASFRNCKFRRQAHFSNAAFLSEGDFSGAEFRDVADFENATFNMAILLMGADFKRKASFRGCTFRAIAYFNNATFQEQTRFYNATFEEEATFHGATFNAEAFFSHAVFRSDVDFTAATFNAHAELSDAQFRAETTFITTTFAAGATLVSSTFGGRVNFSNCSIRGAYFRGALFEQEVFIHGKGFEKEIDFVAATFRDRLIFLELEGRAVGDLATFSIDFQNARIEKPERVSFRNSTLFANWFTNVDPRKFEFVNVEWRGTIAGEIASLRANSGRRPHRVLSLACRQLAVNAEDNNRYDEASKFRYWAMDIRRIERYRGFAFWNLDWWYWAASGYGERIGRAASVLVAVWLIFAWLYYSGVAAFASSPTPSGQPLPFGEALVYSLEVIALQKPTPRPATTGTELIVFIETIAGPLQAALLALAIRRKFLRLS